jgi:N-acetyl-alpha-D-glucosaminyl L-malate synthase BshA
VRALRIAIISHAYPYLEESHAGQFVHELASTLVKLGHQVYSVIPLPSFDHRGEMDSVHLEFYETRDRVSYGRADNEYIKTPKVAVALSLGRAMIKLYQVVREHDIDVIHAHWAVPMGFVSSLVKLMTDKPLVITTHGRDVYVDPEAGAIVPELWYVRPFLRFALRQADRVISVSQDCRRHTVAAGASPDRTSVIYNGVDAKRFSPIESNEHIRQILGVSDAARLVLFVGSLRSYKGVDVLIRAMPLVLESEPLAVVVIIGSGPQKKDLIALRDRLGLQKAVIFAGSIPNSEIVSYENECDVFVLSSRRESFGIAAVEAMACAKPVIGTKVGGLKEVIDDGQTGILVEPNNSEQLAKAILQVLEDKSYAQRLGENARRKVEAKFDWVKIARRTINLYGDVLES